MGIFKLKISFGIFGKKLFVTVEGPPDKIIPFTSDNIFFFSDLLKLRLQIIQKIL